MKSNYTIKNEEIKDLLILYFSLKWNSKVKEFIDIQYDDKYKELFVRCEVEIDKE